MSKKTLWGLIFSLITLNCLTIAFFLTPHHASNQTMAVSNHKVAETVATVGSTKITRQQWLDELESKYGKQTLRDMVNQSVVFALAKKYHIQIPEEEIDQEMNMIKTSYGTMDQQSFSDEKQWRNQIKANILLEELLTKDVKISDQELKKYYKDNKQSYIIEPTYQLAQIVVGTKKEANQVIDELKAGSSFAVLAMERSKDEFSASQGGELGYFNDSSDTIPKEYLTAAKKLSKKQWSKPIQIKDGYAVIFLEDKIDGATYSYAEVKNQIRRQLALNQMDEPVSAESLWKDANVTWFYQNQK